MTIVRIGSISDVSQAFPTEATTGAGGLGSLGELGTLGGLDKAGTAGTPAASGPASFGGILTNMIDQANSADRAAATKVEQLAAGANDDLHGTMIATKEADISMKLVGSVRTKLLDAFHEIWRTSV